MAWSSEFALLVELLEAGVLTMARARGFLEAYGEKNDHAASLARDLAGVERIWTLFITRNYEQLRLLPENEEPNKRGTAKKGKAGD